MTTYELQLNDYFYYVKAMTEAQAIATLLASLSSHQRRWANVIPTGRNR